MTPIIVKCPITKISLTALGHDKDYVISELFNTSAVNLTYIFRVDVEPFPVAVDIDKKLQATALLYKILFLDPDNEVRHYWVVDTEDTALNIIDKMALGKLNNIRSEEIPVDMVITKQKEDKKHGVN